MKPVVLLLVALLIVLGQAPGCSGTRAVRTTDSLRDAIELVGTRPVETTLGDPALRESASLWVELIDQAESTLDLEQFYVSSWPGEALDPVLDAVGRAAARGVRIRLLVDARMHRTYPDPADSLGRLPGVERRTIDYRRLGGGAQHAKMFLVDGRTAFVGSQNFDWRALSHIHELGVTLRDERLARMLGKVFELDWGAAADTNYVPILRADPVPSPIWPIALAPGDTARVRLSASPREMLPDSLDWDLDALVRLIDGARTELVAQMLSYSVDSRGRQDTTLDDALRRAAGRGVRVKLLVSDWQADSERIATVQSLASVPGIDVEMSVVAEYSGGYIPFARVEHCKFLVADSLQTWIGTSNWGPGYFFASRNVGMTIDHAGLARNVRRIFQTSWAAPSAVRVLPDSTYAPRLHGQETPPGHRRYGG